MFHINYWKSPSLSVPLALAVHAHTLSTFLVSHSPSGAKRPYTLTTPAVFHPIKVGVNADSKQLVTPVAPEVGNCAFK